MTRHDRLVALAITAHRWLARNSEVNVANLRAATESVTEAAIKSYVKVSPGKRLSQRKRGV